MERLDYLLLVDQLLLEYVKAITTVGEILSVYDHDKMFPVHTYSPSLSLFFFCFFLFLLTSSFEIKFKFKFFIIYRCMDLAPRSHHRG